MAKANYEQIKYEVQDNILTITLNRPEKMNAFTHIMMDELISAFDAADADDNVRAIIMTGAGRAFCAGADLSAGGATFDREARPDRKGAPLRPNGEVEWSDDAVRDGGGRVRAADAATADLSRRVALAEARGSVAAAMGGPAAPAPAVPPAAASPSPAPAPVAAA